MRVAPFALMTLFAAAPAMAQTDHDQVVGRWGIEARHIATFQRTPGQDAACGVNCPVDVNSLGVRHWVRDRFAWTAGLAFGMGGGSTTTTAAKGSWDTYLGVGPTGGATFLLRSWKHVAVGLSPQIDVLFFMPGGSRAKTFLVNARGLVEAEVHLGFIGLPELTLSLASGVAIGYRGVTKPATTDTGTASAWSVGLSGPESIKALVSNVALRFYF